MAEKHSLKPSFTMVINVFDIVTHFYPGLRFKKSLRVWLYSEANKHTLLLHPGSNYLIKCLIYRILRIMNLTNLGGCNSESDFFRRHCRSVIKVIKLFCGHCVIHEEEGRQHNTRHNHTQHNNKRCESQHNVPEWVVLLY
jgi:hypothetical protein